LLLDSLGGLIRWRSLDGPEGQALHQLVLGDPAGDDHRQGGQGGGRAELGEVQASLVMKPTRNTGTVPAWAAVKFTR